MRNYSFFQPPKGAIKKRRVNELCPEALDGYGRLKYNLELVPIARNNRKNPTLAEKKFWDEIVCNSMTNYRFKQQKPIGNYILDFYCSELLLGVEIDGDYHQNVEQKISDEVRTNELNKIHILIIRYTNDEVLNKIESVKIDFIDKLKHRNNLFNTLPLRGLDFLKVPQFSI